jgi:hypothetical protein
MEEIGDYLFFSIHLFFLFPKAISPGLHIPKS